MTPVDIHVIVPVHNAEAFIGECLDSIDSQEYGGKVLTIVVDDASTDGTRAILRQRGGAQAWPIERRGELASIISGSSAFPALDPATVIAHVCGDDYLPDPHVLSRLAAVYEDPDVWMTYGSYVYDNGEPGPCEALPPQAHAQGDYRQRPWVTSHLRSYRYGLWRRIPPEQFVDPATGRAWFYATDRAMMFPMLEMAREHARFVPDVMYVYRRHPGNVPSTADAGHCQRVADMPRVARLETIYG